MAYKFSDNELDNALFVEFGKDNPSEQTIRELVVQGANINAIDNTGDSVLIDAIFNVQYGLDIRFIQLIIDLGADVNYAEAGCFNCLFDAGLTQRADLVELLLKAGANPNHISEEDGESILDWAVFEWHFCESYYGKESGDRMGEVVKMLKKYGAKYSNDLFADKPEKFFLI
jgi:ankyrin repeat protein